jgi:hypothetical protein
MRRTVATMAVAALALLVAANVMVALSASNAVPQSQADDITVVAPPPDELLFPDCPGEGGQDDCPEDPNREVAIEARTFECDTRPFAVRCGRWEEVFRD